MKIPIPIKSCKAALKHLALILGTAALLAEGAGAATTTETYQLGAVDSVLRAELMSYGITKLGS